MKVANYTQESWFLGDKKRQLTWSGLHSWHWLLLTFCEMESSQISRFTLIDENICYTVKSVNVAGVGIRYLPGSLPIFRAKLHLSSDLRLILTTNLKVLIFSEQLQYIRLELRQLTWHWFLIIFLYKTKNVGCSFKQTFWRGHNGLVRSFQVN